MDLDNKRALKIAILALTALITIFYVIPDLIIAIYTTTLGTATALLIGIYLFFYKNWKIAGTYILLSIILWRILSQHKIEGFETQQWPSELIRQFTQLQATINPQHIFDTTQIQQFATPQEVDYFMKHQQWEWDAPTEALYRAALAKNPFISDIPDNSVAHARKLYSQGQIRQILFMQSPEGRAVINGVVIADDHLNKLNEQGRGIYSYTSGLGKPQALLQCDSATAQPVIVSPYGAKINTHGSVGLLTQARNTWPKETTPITDMAELEQYGFEFPNGAAPCNPCSALVNSDTCNFRIKIKPSDDDY